MEQLKNSIHLRRVEEPKLPSTVTECLNRALQQRHFHVVFHLSTQEEFSKLLLLDRIESGFFLIFPDGQIGTYFASKLFAMAACVPGLRPVAATLLHCLHEADRQKLRAKLVDVDSKSAICGFDLTRKQLSAMLKVN
uniref:Tick transposon n=1 Tax=Steinernema glaseri TaxID=37863 RepID=A0A1I8AUD2_9BILA